MSTRDLLKQAQSAEQRLDMTIDVLFSVIEESGNWVEGNFALKHVHALRKIITERTFALGTNTADEALTSMTQHFENVIATANEHIARLEA